MCSFYAFKINYIKNYLLKFSQIQLKGARFKSLDIAQAEMYKSYQALLVLFSLKFDPARS